MKHRCPQCGADVPMRWRDAIPQKEDAPQLVCPACGQFLAFPARQRAAWVLAYLGAGSALIWAFREAWPRQPYDSLPYFAILAATSIAFFPFWRLVVYVPRRPYGAWERIALTCAVYGAGTLLVWWLVRRVF